MNLSNTNNSNEIKIENLENNNDCKVEFSLFEYKNSNNELNSIYLLKDIPQTFIFDQQNKQVKYRYLLVDNDKDLEITITPTDIGKSNIISLTINDNENPSYKDFELKENQKNYIKVDNTDIYCKNDYQPCKIGIILKAEEFRGNPSAEISIGHKSESYDDPGYENKTNNETNNDTKPEPNPNPNNNTNNQTNNDTNNQTNYENKTNHENKTNTNDTNTY